MRSQLQFGPTIGTLFTLCNCAPVIHTTLLRENITLGKKHQKRILQWKREMQGEREAERERETEREREREREREKETEREKERERYLYQLVF